jgi:hypothetical protein
VDGRPCIEPDVGHLPPIENPDAGAIVLVNDVGCSITVLLAYGFTYERDAQLSRKRAICAKCSLETPSINDVF